MGQLNAIVTGSNRGMGRAIVKEFAQRGINVWACARTKNDSFEEEIKEVAIANDVWIKPVYFNLDSEKSIKEGFKSIFQEKKSIDILVNNAGVAHVGAFEMISAEQMESMFRVNAFAPMILTKYVLKRMKQQKSGVIINVSSISGMDHLSGNTVYGASKAALIAFTRCLSVELGDFGIRVNAVAPGSTQTDMLDEFVRISGDELESRSALKRYAEPEEIARVVAFLSSNDASYINGEVIRIDGGVN